MNARDEFYRALTAVTVGTAKRFLYRRHPELWDRDAASSSVLPERKRWIEIVKALDQIVWQLPAYDQNDLQSWEQELEQLGLPSLVGLHLRWSKDYQRLLKTAKLQGEYDAIFITRMCAQYEGISSVEEAFWSTLLTNGSPKRASDNDGAVPRRV